MILNSEYRQKFEKLKERFGCNDLELEALLRESHKSTSSNRLVSIESLIDNQLQEINTPRGKRIYAIDWSESEPINRWERTPKIYNNDRLTAREIKELFDNVHPSDVRFSSMPNYSRKRLLKVKKIAIKNRINKFRQRIESRVQHPAQRLNNVLHSLGRHGQRELLREGRRVVRSSARRQLRQMIGI
jgi:hypothetical protein